MQGDALSTPSHGHAARGLLRWLCLAACSGWILFATVLLVPKNSRVFRCSVSLCKRLGLSANLPAKVFHFTAYAAWAWLAAGALASGYRRELSGRRAVVCLLALALFALLPEALQALTRFRHASLFDVGINLAGGSGCLLVRPTERSAQPIS